MSKPLNVDDELRLHVHGLVAMVSAGYAVASQATDDIMKLILADRKKHELQARIDELSHVSHPARTSKQQHLGLDYLVEDRLKELKQGLRAEQREILRKEGLKNEYTQD